MQRKFVFSEGEFYHIYNRGVDKRVIFLEDEDYRRFVRLLFLSNGARSFELKEIEKKKLWEYERGEPLVDIISYCLMSNHFHLLVRERGEGGASQFMKKLQTGYVMYFNSKYDRSGSLFQGPFRARHVDSDTYLKHVSTYIHLNALDLCDAGWKKRGLKDSRKAENFITTYQYSSLIDHCGSNRNESKLLSLEAFPTYYNSAEEILDDIHDWTEIAPLLQDLEK